MLSLFNPWALTGLLLLAIPVIIHLFKPRKTRRTPFTNLSWLRESQHKLTRRVQWHQLLLFLFRAALVVALVLMLARPLLNLGGREEAVERFIILDRSRTMGYAVEGVPTPFDEGRQRVEALLSSSGPNDRTAVLLTARRSEVLSPLSRDPQAPLTALRAASPLLEEADLGAALSMVRSLLAERREGVPVELVFVTNSLQASWSQSAISAFLKVDAMQGLKVRLVDVAPVPMQNAWLAEARLMEARGRQPRRIEFTAGWSGSGDVERSFALTGLPGMPEAATRGLLRPGELTRFAIEVPPEMDLGGEIATLTMQPHDGLPDDDALQLSLQPRGLEKVLVIESQVTQVSLLQPGLHLRVALQALAKVQPLEIERATPDQVTPEQIAAAGMIVWIEPDGMPEATLLALQNRVRSGAGLAIFLGPGVNVSFYNSRLVQEDGNGLSPVRLNNVVEDRPHEANAGGFTGIDWTHPLLVKLFDPTYNDLPQTRVRGYFTLGEPVAGTRVIASLRGSTPALMEHPHGAGNVLVANFTANDAWTDLPRRTGYLPLLDRMVAHLTGGFGRADFLVGEPISIPLGPYDKAPEVTVTAPGDSTLRPVLRLVSGQYLLQLEPVDTPGVYQIRIAGEETSRPFVVRTSRADSSLVVMNTDLLRQWWEPALFSTESPSDTGEGDTQKRYPLWPWLALLAALAFIGEMYLVHSLCPRLNPSIAESQVREHGLIGKQQEPSLS